MVGVVVDLQKCDGFKCVNVGSRDEEQDLVCVEQKVVVGQPTNRMKYKLARSEDDYLPFQLKWRRTKAARTEHRSLRTYDRSDMTEKNWKMAVGEEMYDRWWEHGMRRLTFESEPNYPFATQTCIGSC